MPPEATPRPSSKRFIRIRSALTESAIAKSAMIKVMMWLGLRLALGMGVKGGLWMLDSRIGAAPVSMLVLIFESISLGLLIFAIWEWKVKK